MAYREVTMIEIRLYGTTGLDRRYRIIVLRWRVAV